MSHKIVYTPSPHHECRNGEEAYSFGVLCSLFAYVASFHFDRFMFFGFCVCAFPCLGLDCI